MTIDTKIDVSSLLGILNFLMLIWGIIYVRPLRDARQKADRSEKRVQELEKRFVDTGLAEVAHTLEDHESRLTQVQQHVLGCPAVLARDYVARSDLRASEMRRDNQLELITEKQDQAAVAIAEVRTNTVAIQRSVDTLFNLWNQEHRRQT